MPYFLEGYVEEIRKKRKDLERLLLGEAREKRFYERYIDDYWHALTIKNVSKSTIAIDSSDGYIETKTGGIIHMVRAIGIGNNNTEKKALQLNPIVSPSEDSEFARFRGYYREHLEHIVAIDCIKNITTNDNISEKPYIMIDGSFYGRISHFPREINIRGYYDFLIEYYKTLSELFVVSRENGVPLIGVSKDSRTQFLRLKLLEKILKEALEEISNINLKREIIDLWSIMLKQKIYTLRSLYQKLSESGPHEKFILEIFEEAMNFYADSNLIPSLVEKPGYTTPILLGRPIYTLDPILTSLIKGVETYIKQTFPRLTQIRGEAFIEYAKEILTEIPELPAIISFYVLFETNDVPIRVDVPSYVFGINKSIKDTHEWKFIKVDERQLQEIVSLLYSLYAGLKHYNILLEEADRRVKLHKKTLIDIYEKVLMKELGLLLEHSRGEKRVKYP